VYQEGVKKSGLSQALAKHALTPKNLMEARLTVPAFFHTFQALFSPGDRLARIQDIQAGPQIRR